MLKVLRRTVPVVVLFIGVSCCYDIVAEESPQNEQTKEQADNSNDSAENKQDSSYRFDGFLNIKTAHERSNNYFWGAKNTSAMSMSPFLQIGNFIIESDFYYGRQFKFSGAANNFRNLSESVGDIAAFAEAYEKEFKDGNNKYTIGNCFKKANENGLKKAHFYRNYSRLLYINKKHDFNIIVGDTATRNTIGFQRIVAGAGISIFRQGGNGSVVNPGLPIFITRLSKAEVRLNGEILALRVLRPGVYTIDQIAPEATLPGAKVKISDQLSRSETFNVEYFSGYDMPDLYKDDFDVTVAFPSTWDLDDPQRITYDKKARFSANYRRTFRENVTYTLGTQAYEAFTSVDAGLIFNTKYGKIAPSIGYSNNRARHEANAGAISLYYAAPANKCGVFFETLFSVMEKGYGSVGFDEKKAEDFNEYLEKYLDKIFNTNDGKDLKKQLENSSEHGSSRQVVVRLYTKPIWNITPAFIFKGNWVTKSERTRDYTLALTTTVLRKCNLTLSAGLTYDDPSKGFNRKSPDRRIGLACAVNFNEEWSSKYTYTQYYDEMKLNYASLTYNPKNIKGLELCWEETWKPGLSSPCFSVDYDNKYFCAKFEENQAHCYEDKESKTSNGHANGQRISFGTSLGREGFRNVRKMNVTIIRTMDDYRKKN